MQTEVPTSALHLIICLLNKWSTLYLILNKPDEEGISRDLRAESLYKAERKKEIVFAKPSLPEGPDGKYR